MIKCSNRDIFNFFVKRIRHTQGQIVSIILLMGMTAAVMLILPLWVQQLIDTVLPGKNLVVLSRHLLLGGGLMLLIQGLLFARDFFIRRFAHNLCREVKIELVQAILRSQIMFVANRRKGDIVSRLSSDMDVLYSGIVSGLFLFLANGIVAVCFFFLMAKLSWGLTCSTILLLVPVAWTMSFFTVRIHARTGASQQELAGLNNAVEELVSNIREIKICNQEERILEDYKELTRRSLAALIGREWFRLLHPGVIAMVAFVGTGVFLFLYSWAFSHGLLSSEILPPFIACLVLLYSPVQETAKSIGYIGEFFAVGRRLLEMARYPVEEQGLSLPSMNTVDGRVRFENVSFSYDLYCKSRPVLDDLNFEVQAGETVGIIGSSGAGKSTLVNLLTRLTSPTCGKIFFDDMNIADYSLQSCRRQMAIVSQEPMLFDGSIAENIRFAGPEATTAQLRRAARLANVDGFVGQMENGYETRIGPYGCRLSVGQKQRISIARALLLDPVILILDEPTSALDRQSEQVVYDSLAGLWGSRTIFIVSHRPALLVKMDRVLLLQGGCLQEVSPANTILMQEDHPR